MKIMSKGEATKGKILERAVELFNLKGYSGASLADLMRATGLEKGGIYNHFGSKEEIALHAFDHAVEVISRRFEEALAGKKHAADRLLAVISVFAAYGEDPPFPGGCPILNTAIESDYAHPRLRERALEAVERLRALIRRIVEKGVERGELSPEADGDYLATLFLATMEGAVMLSHLYRDGAPLRQAASHLAQLVEGLAARKPGILQASPPVPGEEEHLS